MSELAKAPLVEAWIELRWGKPRLAPGTKAAEFVFQMEDTDFFHGQFRKVADARGFNIIEEINPNLHNLIPHIVKFRFRKGPEAWPCIQTGLGLFTVNQINEGYQWESFKASAIEGLQMLDDGHPLGLTGISRFGIELRYRDGFPLGEGQTPPEFLRGNMEIGFDLPPTFLDFQPLGKDFSGMRFAFTLDTSKPKGHLITELTQGTINGQPGFVMDMTVRSTQENCPEWEMETISSWLENAHEIHGHAFKTLISPAFARTFK